MSMRPRKTVAPGRHLVPLRQLDQGILVLRGQRVMLDETLAALDEVRTRELVQAVKRNGERFPIDFMFQVTTGNSSV